MLFLADILKNILMEQVRSLQVSNSTGTGQKPTLERRSLDNLKTNMDQDPAPYLEMKQHGATAEEVYRRARADGFKNYECLVLIMGVFGLELDDARKIGHQTFFKNATRLES